MSDDFIREVDEEMRRERLAQLWKQYNGMIIGGISLIILVVGGQSFWERQKTKKMATASGQYNQALQFYEQKKQDQGDASLKSLQDNTSDGYALLARFRLAASLGMQDNKKGIEAYDALAADNKLDIKWRELAELRASTYLIDGENTDKAVVSLTKLAEGQGAWRHSARELLFALAMKKGDYSEADKWVNVMALDNETPSGIRVSLADYKSLASGGALGSDPSFTKETVSPQETPSSPASQEGTAQRDAQQDNSVPEQELKTNGATPEPKPEPEKSAE